MNNTLTIDSVGVEIPIVLERYRSLSSSVNLKDRHRAIFEEKFGLKDGTTKTYSEVAEKFNISATRVRQICAFVLFKIDVIS